MSVILPKPPVYLSAPAKKWWKQIVGEFALEDHHLHLLTHAAEAWDECRQAREIIDKNGLTFEDRFGQPRARPEVAIARNARIVFARLLRELCLDVAPPEEHGRFPRRPGTR